MVTVSLLLFLYHLCICGCQLYNLVYVCIFSYFCCVQLFVTLRTVAHQAPLSMDSSGKNTGVGCHFLLQGIFLTQGSNLHLFVSPALQMDPLLLSHQRNPLQSYKMQKKYTQIERKKP